VRCYGEKKLKEIVFLLIFGAGKLALTRPQKQHAVIGFIFASLYQSSKQNKEATCESYSR
jgi:hypothetical protein